MPACSPAPSFPTESAESASLSLSHNSAQGEIVNDVDKFQIENPDLPFQLSGSQRKTAYALRMNVEEMFAACGEGRTRRERIESGSGCIGFATFTVGDTSASGFRQVWDHKEASRRVNNLGRRLLAEVFERYVLVTERHKSGAIHFHLVGIIAGRPDIRTGFDHADVARGDYSSASPALRRIWALLREKLPGLGFGRSEVTPVKTTGPQIANYVAKYVEKNLFARGPEDKGKKLVRYGGWSRVQLKPNDFAWGTPRAAAWRIKVRQLAGTVGVKDRERMPEIFGPRWAWRMTKIMHVVSDEVEPGFNWTWPEREAARRLVSREVLRPRDIVEQWHPNLWRGPGRMAA